MVGSFALILGIALLAKFAVGAYFNRSLANNPAMSPEAVAKRIKPVGDLVIVEAAGAKTLKSGEQVYTAVCAACHATGVADAPKFDDKAGWSGRIAEGYDHLVEAAIKGVRTMPPRGGNPDLSDIEVARAVAHMANAAGANFKAPEPQADKPAATVAAAAPAAAPAPTAPAAPALAAAPAADAGQKVYETMCVACHGSGVAGAPKTGDKAAWAARIAQGAATLHEHALKGFQGKAGMMPAKGGNPALPDADVKAAVDYMAAQAK